MLLLPPPLSPRLPPPLLQEGVSFLPEGYSVHLQMLRYVEAPPLPSVLPPPLSLPLLLVTLFPLGFLLALADGMALTDTDAGEPAARLVSVLPVNERGRK